MKWIAGSWKRQILIEKVLNSLFIQKSIQNLPIFLHILHLELCMTNQKTFWSKCQLLISDKNETHTHMTWISCDNHAKSSWSAIIHGGCCNEIMFFGSLAKFCTLILWHGKLLANLCESTQWWLVVWDLSQHLWTISIFKHTKTCLFSYLHPIQRILHHSILAYTIRWYFIPY